jgi:hypothetical protein
VKELGRQQAAGWRPRAEVTCWSAASVRACEQALGPHSVKKSKLKRIMFLYFPEAEFDAF